MSDAERRVKTKTEHHAAVSQNRQTRLQKTQEKSSPKKHVRLICDLFLLGNFSLEMYWTKLKIPAPKDIFEPEMSQSKNSAFTFYILDTHAFLCIF